MYFNHDPSTNSYYYGETAPYKGMGKDLLFNQSHQVIGVDVETISLKERTAVGVGISLKPNLSFYFQLFPEVSPSIPWHLLTDPKVTKVMHNGLFDLPALREYDVDTTAIVDTMIMARLLCYQFTGLLDMSPVHRMEVHDMKEVLEEHGAKTTLELPQEVTARKCMQDSSATLQLYHELWEDTNKEYLATEMQVIPICIDMSYRGLLIDQNMRQIVEDILQEQSDYYLGLCEEEGFLPSSAQQVAWTLGDRGAYSVFRRLPYTNWKKTQLSTSKETLKKMDDPLAGIVLQYREYAKLNSTYIKPWAHDERAYTRFHLDAITGRPSSTDRNMQNIPGKFRKDGSKYPVNCRGVLLPDSGTWTDVDWEQLEPRVLAYLSEDKEMQHIFSLPKYNPDGSKNEDADIHLQVAMFMGVVRRLGKLTNLAMTYGATDETLAEQLGIKDIGRIRQLKDMWGRKFPQAMDWIDSRQEDALRTGMARTVFGRNIRLPTEEEESADSIKRKAIDYPCQGSAAEILKRGLIRMQKLNLSLQVHDELLVDGYVPDYTFKPLEDIAPFRTPVEVKYLERWE
ncbi:hypothetical protein LCGC14_0392670 [marine sediment metagenome]|uniref:DNA-directed DNA polymerase family A palm domain-containing protein n=1 Tax=marine sediment metagenome TaxID=412755 RepID=A0A0F9VKZ8_9ZZZZ